MEWSRQHYTETNNDQKFYKKNKLKVNTSQIIFIHICQQESKYKNLYGPRELTQFLAAELCLDFEK